MTERLHGQTTINGNKRRYTSEAGATHTKAEVTEAHEGTEVVVVEAADQ